MNPLSVKQKSLILAVIVLVLAGIGGAVYVTTRFQVTSTDPKQNKSINTYNVVVINFNRSINADNAQITAVPSFKFTKSVDDKKLVIRPSDALQNKTKYTVKVSNVCEASKQSSCVGYTLTFSTDETLQLNNQSTEQQQQIVAPVDAQYKDNPILAILPVNEADFAIDARPTGDNYSYVVITPSVASGTLTPDEYNNTYSKYYQEGKTYLTAKGYALQGTKYKVVSSQEFAALSSGGD